MLVLDRKKNESIYVSGPCVIKISEIYRNCQRVRISFVAPKSTRIIRVELMTHEEASIAAQECYP